MASEQTKDVLVEALFGLLAEYAYRDITLAMIAERAGSDIASLRGQITGKDDIIVRFAAQNDQAVLAGLDQDMIEEASHERLFDVLMRRFDALAPYREGVRGLRNAAREDQRLAFSLWRIAVTSQHWMLSAADLPSEGTRGALAARGLALSYARIIDVWLEDEDPGLARTMAALDAALRRGARAMQFVDGLDRLASPFRVLIGRAMEKSRRRRERNASSQDEVHASTRP